MSVILALALIVASICLTAMSAAYATLSSSHLRHWARKQDPAAKKLYPLKAIGSAAYLTIELLRAISLSAAIIFLGTFLSAWLAWLVSAVLFFVAFVVLTQLYLKPLGIRLLIWLSQPLSALTNILKPITSPLGRVFDRFIEEEPITLTRLELEKMFDAVQPEDTDLSPEELGLLSNVLKFSKKTVHDLMTPKSKIVSVKVSETLSPVVIDELHNSGHARFPVMSVDGKAVIGVLNMHDLADLKAHASIEDTMQQKIYFIDEDRDLDHVLQVFYKTKQTLFIVHNTASDMVGLISIEDVVQEILGKPITEDSSTPAKNESVQE